MIKKISYIVLSIAILTSGYFALTKLNYWERSIRIFKLSNSAQSFEGRRMRDPGALRDNRSDGDRRGFNRQEGFRGRPEESEVHQLPDSVKAKIGAINQNREMRNRNIAENHSQRGSDQVFSQSGRFEPGMRNHGDRGRDGYTRGRKIFLANVIWYMAVFASFTILFIYADKAVCFIRKRIKLRPQS